LGHKQKGILLHISSLPSNEGIGTLGEDAYKFVDFLVKAGQDYWQVLPVGHTGFGDSPYQSFSSYAGNPYFVDLEAVRYGCIKKNCPINYSKLYIDKYRALRKNLDRVIARSEVTKQSHRGCSFRGIASSAKPPRNDGEKRVVTNGDNYSAFCRDNAEWLGDYAFFMALKDAHFGASWDLWEDDLRYRRDGAMKRWRDKLSGEIEFWKGTQFAFFVQWGKLREYASGKGIKIIGDMPIYSAFDSADVWARPEWFRLTDDLKLSKIAGVPPDYFSVKGQLWGNPLYNWKKQRDDGYSFWENRLKASAKLFDVLRIDHFRAFASYFVIDADAETAKDGHWEDGPGAELFDRLEARGIIAPSVIARSEATKQSNAKSSAHGIASSAKPPRNDDSNGLEIIAEDLGTLTPDVYRLMEHTGYSGMKVLQFGLSDDDNNPHLPRNYLNDNCIVYTGTHDNDTSAGWYKTLDENSKNRLNKYLKPFRSKRIPHKMIEWAYLSPAHTAIIPMQDVLCLGSNGRMNTPSTGSGNWRWRIGVDMLGDDIAEILREMGQEKQK